MSTTPVIMSTSPMSTSVRQRASPAAIANAPRVYPVHHDYSYTLTYDVSDTSSISSSQSVSSQEEFDVLDAAAVLSDITCCLTDVVHKMMAAMSPDQSQACLPFIGQILDKCEKFVAVHQHKLDDRSDCSSTASSSSTPSQAKSFIDKITSFISSAAPSGVFSRRRSKRRHAKKLRSLVHPELFSMWYHAPQLFTTTKPAPSSEPKPLPTVNLKDVNTRAIANVPRPNTYPLHSCSQDPMFYNSDLHSKKSPFGFMYGYMTNLGLVPVPDKPVHGYVWDQEAGRWILCATASQHEDLNFKKRSFSKKRGGGREKG